MKKQTSKRAVWLKSLFLLPLTALLLLSFSKTEIIYSEADRIIEDTYLEESAEIKIEIKEDLGIWLNGSKIAVTSLAEKPHQNTTSGRHRRHCSYICFTRH